MIHTHVHADPLWLFKQQSSMGETLHLKADRSFLQIFKKTGNLEIP